MLAKNSAPRGVGSLAEAQAFLDANPDIEAVQLRDGLAATVDWYRTLPDHRG